MTKDEFRRMFDEAFDEAIQRHLPVRPPVALRPPVRPPAAAANPLRPRPTRPVLVSSHGLVSSRGVGVSPVARLRAIGWKPTPFKPPPKDPRNDYRGSRKYTAKKLASYVNDPGSIRARIGQPDDATPLLAKELVQYLVAIEGEIQDWKAKRLPPPDGVPRKRGRPSNAERAARMQAQAEARTG